ncbi:MAG: hypothetical protein AAGC46_08410 [Solirubrobacteraceae bacterium]|nr:hypothetical protein [Patulibacter sp.]
MPRIRPTLGLGLLLAASSVGVAAPTALAADDPTVTPAPTPIVTPTPTPVPPTPTPRPPASPPAVSFVSATDTTVTVRISSGAWGIEVSLDGKYVSSANPNGEYTFKGLQPETTYAVTAKAFYGIYGEDGISPASAPLSVTTTSAIPATPTPTPVPVSAALAGSTSLSLRGGWFSGVGTGPASATGTIEGSTGVFGGTVSVGPVSATILLLGTIPLKATLAFTPAGAATSTSDATSTSLKTSQDVAFKRVTFGGVSLAGAGCHTAAPVAISLKGAPTLFTLGGIASGSVSLGRLTGCSTFGTLTANNAGLSTLSLSLTPATGPVPTT